MALLHYAPLQKDDPEAETLEHLALVYLATVEHALICWIQKAEGKGYCGFRVWSPDQGHVVTVLEIG